MLCRIGCKIHEKNKMPRGGGVLPVFKEHRKPNKKKAAKKTIHFFVFLILEPSHKTFRWCAFEKEMAKCQDFVKLIPDLANASNAEGHFSAGSCVKVTSDEDCMKKIKANEADLITLDGGKVYVAGIV